MRRLLVWGIALLAWMMLFGLVLTPAASAWNPVYRYPPNANYPVYPVLPHGYVYAGCVGCSANPAPYNYYPGYNYIYPTVPYYYNYNNNYNNYNYVTPQQPYAFVPPSNFVGNWGSFGTYQNWANAFLSQHGRWPNQQDINDYWWSQWYASVYGHSPYYPYYY